MAVRRSRRHWIGALATQAATAVGTVIAVGSGLVRKDGTRLALDVKPGDVILFGKYTNQEIKLDGEDYLVMREDEVLAVIETDLTGRK